MKIGVFDHLDGGHNALADYYEDRLRLIEAYDRHGFYCYHVAEHHATPLGYAPSPSVFLSAVGQRTRHIRFGSLVYILPLYHPLRLAEEICMLDQMSRGRFQVGVGRGISPIELGYFAADVPRTQALYMESFQVLLKALTQERVSHEGEHLQFHDVPMVLRPYQQPHPPLWYGVGALDGVDWCVSQGVNAVINGPFERIRQMSDRFRDLWAQKGVPEDRQQLMGTARHIVIAGSDAEAIAIAERGYLLWLERFIKLWKAHGMRPPFGAMPADFKTALGQVVVAGSAATVRETLLDHLQRTGVNYLMGRFAFGDLTLAESTESVERFAAEVMPALLARP